jgi:hypothetical protein
MEGKEINDRNTRNANSRNLQPDHQTTGRRTTADDDARKARRLGVQKCTEPISP